jgi:hypothetical protein
MIQFIASFILSGFTGRIRGGLGNEFVRKLLGKPDGWEIPNNYIRSVWAISVTLLIWPATFILWPLTFIAAFIGVMPGYWKGKFNLADPANRNWKNYFWLTLRGMFIALPVAVLYSFYSDYTKWPAVVVGGLFVIYYLTGYRITKRSPIQAGSQWGEWLLYGAIGASL